MKSEEISNNLIIVQRAPNFLNTFQNLQDLRGLYITETRRDALAEKRQEKLAYGRPTSAVLPEWVGPPLAPLTPEEKHRIVSISDPSKSSAGSKLYTATQEKESETLATSFFRTVLILLFLDNPPVTWPTGRDDAKPVLRCRNRYQSNTSSAIVLIFSPLAAEIKLGHERIGARTDGGLQIFLPRKDLDSLVAWDRSYYEVALEVLPKLVSLIPGQTLSSIEKR